MYKICAIYYISNNLQRESKKQDPTLIFFSRISGKIGGSNVFSTKTTQESKFQLEGRLEYFLTFPADF